MNLQFKICPPPTLGAPKGGRRKFAPPLDFISVYAPELLSLNRTKYLEGKYLKFDENRSIKINLIT